MFVVCVACNHRGEISSATPPRSKLRCSRCGHLQVFNTAAAPRRHPRDDIERPTRSPQLFDTVLGAG
jgi:hypothetical protein